jgi:hypothetical protein
MFGNHAKMDYYEKKSCEETTTAATGKDIYYNH